MIRKLLAYLREFRKDAILAPSLIVLEVICELVLPLLMERIIDVGINGNGGVSYIVRMGGAMLIISVLSMFCGVFAAKHAAYASQGFGRNLRNAMFGKIQSFSFSSIDRFSAASLITRTTNDVNMLQTTVAMSLRILVRAPMQLITALIVCLFMNARLTVILVVAIPVLFLAAGSLMKRVRPLFKIFQEKIDGLNGAVQEDLIGIRTVKAYVREEHENERFGRANQELLNAGLAAVMRIIVMMPMVMLIMNAALMAVFWFGGKQVIAGTMLTGELYSFFLYIAQVLISAMMVAICFFQMTRASACANRILEVLESEPDITDGVLTAGELPPALGKIEFRDVSFRYREGTGDDVLSHVSFSIEPGGFVGIVGATGTGKSTLVNLIPRFYDVTGGSVFVDGTDVRDYPVEALRSRIGMVLQKNVLFKGSIRENLLWGDKNGTEDEMIRAAKDAQAHDFITAMPDGYDTMLDQGGTNVSGGQRQRLCIARAMLRHPAILILDDSTSAVDSATEAEIQRSFHENLKDTTVLIIAQRISSVRYADKIIVLEDDHISGIGSHEELLRSNQIYREIFQSQQEGAIFHE